MTEEQIKEELLKNERDTMQCVCDSLRMYGENIKAYLAEFIASLCNIDKELMFSSSCEHYVVQARWLYFYAYRYMTNEPYRMIGIIPKWLGKSYTKGCVAKSINAMYLLIEQQPIWRKRWLIVKRIIKESNGSLSEPPVQITITVPKNVEVTINKE
jgi:hypothetical protein